jgi:hypothetical protein
MQLDRRQVELQQAHVLHDQRIRARLVKLPGQAPRLVELVVAQDRVERDENFGVVAVRVGCQPLDVGDAVAGVRPRTEGRPADVHRVGAMRDRLDAEVGILGGGEQFKGRGGRGHGWAGTGRAGVGKQWQGANCRRLTYGRCFGRWPDAKPAALWPMIVEVLNPV